MKTSRYGLLPTCCCGPQKTKRRLCSTSSGRASEKRLHAFAPVQAHRPLLTVVYFDSGVHAKEMIDRCTHIIGRIRRRGGKGADLVRFADHLSAAYAGAGEQAEETGRPVIAAGGLRTGHGGDLRRPA